MKSVFKINYRHISFWSNMYWRSSDAIIDALSQRFIRLHSQISAILILLKNAIIVSERIRFIIFPKMNIVHWRQKQVPYNKGLEMQNRKWMKSNYHSSCKSICTDFYMTSIVCFILNYICRKINYEWILCFYALRTCASKIEHLSII